MSTIELTLENFESTIVDNDLVIVDFWAEWCGPCRGFAPVFEKAAGKHTDAVFGKVDTVAQKQLAAEFGIQAIPTLMVFREKVLVYNEAGALPAGAFERLITEVKGLDMDDVRKQIAEHEHDHEHGPDCNHGHADEPGDDPD